MDVLCTWNFRHVLVIQGNMITTGQEFVIANIYAPCDLMAKQAIWLHLSQFVLNFADVNLCICGDFNSVRSEDERRGRGVVARQAESVNFNNFIDGCF